MVRRLDVVGLRLGEAVDALSDTAVKGSVGIGPVGPIEQGEPAVAPAEGATGAAGGPSRSNGS